jgi:cobalamin biosynthesis Mg chelatase CobN
MKKQTYQPPELRDASNNIVQAGTYGRYTPLANADNTGVLDYINNNLEALYDMINAHKNYVASKADLPAAGDAGTIYVASDTGIWYGWDAVKKAYVAYSDPRTAADEAKASETAAKASETAAAASQKAAATSETNASKSATDAANASASAGTSATSAASSASTASAKLDAVNSASKIATDTLAQAQKLTTANGGLSVYVDSDGHLCYRIIATA